MTKIVNIHSVDRMVDGALYCVVDIDFEDGNPISQNNIYVARSNDTAPVNTLLLQEIAAKQYSVGVYVEPEPEPVVVKQPPAPTKEQLMAQLAALSAQIQALE